MRGHCKFDLNFNFNGDLFSSSQAMYVRPASV